MIRSIALQNFQSHESSLLEFDPGINILSGDSDSGKTAILRALSWVLTNRPTGEAFRRTGSESTMVTVDTDGGAISRVRSDRENLYVGVHAERLAAMGASVPESVLELLRMSSDISIQRQLDAPFLLSCSAGEVAQRLNAVVGLDEIDIGLATAARRVRQNQATFSVIDMRCKELFAQVESFAYLVQMEQDILLVEDYVEQRLILTGREDSLARCIQDGKGFVSLLAELPDVDMLLPLVADSEQLLGQREKQMAAIQNLSALVMEIEDVIERLDHIPDMDGLLLDCEEAFSIVKQLTEQRQIGSQLQAIIRDAVDAVKVLQEVGNLVAKNEDRFRKEFPLICPLCGSKGRK